jgi:hypothetical protein
VKRAALIAVPCAIAAICGVAYAEAPAHHARPHQTIQQINARKLLAEYQKTQGCGCTGATRAHDRTMARAELEQRVALHAHAGD